MLKVLLSVASLTFASRLLGLCRDVLIARVFGVGLLTDAFFAVFRFPNLLRRFTAEGSLTQAFVPAYSQQQQSNQSKADALAGETMVILSLVLLLISVIAIIFAPFLVSVLIPGLVAKNGAIDLFRIVFPYIILISLVALLSGILNANKHFGAAAAATLFLNISMIIATLYLAPLFEIPIFSLAWAVIVGGVIQLIWIIWHVRKAQLWPTLVIRLPPTPSVLRMLKLMSHSALGAGAAQLNLLINLFIASFLPVGSISWLYYADRLMELPAGLLGATIATVILPRLSSLVNDSSKFTQLLDYSLRLIVFLSIPATIGLFVLAMPLVSTLFFYGEFSLIDVSKTKTAILAYSVGIIGLVAVRPLAAAFFARQDALLPVYAAVITLITTQILNLVFVCGLGFAHAGLAFSISLSACVNALILLIMLKKRQWYQPLKEWHTFFIQVIIASAVMATVILAIRPPDDYWIVQDAITRIGQLTFIVIVAIATYFFTAYILGLRPRHFRPAFEQ